MRDTTACEVRGLRDAPVANQTRVLPPIYIPGPIHCPKKGECYRRPGYWAGGGIETVDANEDLRDRVIAQCMADRGYVPVNLPRCRDSDTAAAVYQPRQNVPPLSDTSCVITYRDGGWRIIDPG